MLEEHGFRTTSANSGIAMREVLAGDGLPVDAVVLDCLMPGELGPALALHAKSLHLPVVMISGSPDAMELPIRTVFSSLPSHSTSSILSPPSNRRCRVSSLGSGMLDVLHGVVHFLISAPWGYEEVPIVQHRMTNQSLNSY